MLISYPSMHACGATCLEHGDERSIHVEQMMISYTSMHACVADDTDRTWNCERLWFLML
jgi:hypothetical protein